MLRSLNCVRDVMLGCGCVLSLAVLSGCPAQSEYKAATNKDVATEAEHADHAHEHAAPHGGHLIELGEHQYNVEVVFDGASKVLTLYVLDAHAENAVAIASSELVFEFEHGDHEDEIKLTAMPQEGDADGKSSKFVSSGTDEHLKEVADIEGLHGHVHVTIYGKEYEGALSHDHDHDHDHADHDHEGDDHDHDKKPE